MGRLFARPSRRQSSHLAFALFVVLPQPVSAITIDTIFVDNGETGPFGGGVIMGQAPPDITFGGGDLQTIMRAAADVWERALLDDNYTLTIYHGWNTFSGTDALGGMSGFKNVFIDGAKRIRNATIKFKRNHSNWFLDPTPTLNEEYGSFVETMSNWGGIEPVNTRRVFADPDPGTGADRLDILMAAMHEIGHAVGWASGVIADYNNDTDESFGSVTVTSPRPLPGTTITYGCNGNHACSGDLIMFNRINEGQRKYPTDTDIIAAAQFGRYINADVGRDIIALAGDLNGDGLVNELDLSPFIDALATPTSLRPDQLLRSDLNMDGLIDILDIAPFVDTLSNDASPTMTLNEILGLAQVPEPATLTMLVVALLMMRGANLRRRTRGRPRPCRSNT